MLDQPYAAVDAKDRDRALQASWLINGYLEVPLDVSLLQQVQTFEFVPSFVGRRVRLRGYPPVPMAAPPTRVQRWDESAGAWVEESGWTMEDEWSLRSIGIGYSGARYRATALCGWAGPTESDPYPPTLAQATLALMSRLPTVGVKVGNIDRIPSSSRGTGPTNARARIGRATLITPDIAELLRPYRP